MGNIHETIKEIKSQFRLYMNGAISKSMREKGLGYKLNFGIEYPRLKEIAAGYEKDHDLAQALWKEDIRECKIMAGLLQPIETMFPEIADIWIDGMTYPELADYTVMNLFQYLPYASEAAFRWMADDRERYMQCGFLLVTRLFMKGLHLNERGEQEFLDQAFVALEDNRYPVVRKAAATARKKFAAQSVAARQSVMKQLFPLVKSKNPETAALAVSIKEELMA